MHVLETIIPITKPEDRPGNAFPDAMLKEKERSPGEMPKQKEKEEGEPAST